MAAQKSDRKWQVLLFTSTTAHYAIPYYYYYCLSSSDLVRWCCCHVSLGVIPTNRTHMVSCFVLLLFNLA